MYRKLVTVPVIEGGEACFWLDELRGFINLERYIHITCVDQTGDRWHIHCATSIDDVKRAIAEAELILIQNNTNGIGTGAYIR